MTRQLSIADPRLTDWRRPTVGVSETGTPHPRSAADILYGVCATLRANRRRVPWSSPVLLSGPSLKSDLCLLSRPLFGTDGDAVAGIEDTLDRIPGPLHTNPTETVSMMNAIIVCQYFQQLKPTELPLPRSMATRGSAMGTADAGGTNASLTEKLVQVFICDGYGKSLFVVALSAQSGIVCWKRLCGVQ
ncbi:hypothetical protein LY78DRAFT_652097 [Colletotrichum sublineola]|nr:hypothetical protein LY78DRAFT_652097 [Colletotrichum sublineola]